MNLQKVDLKIAKCSHQAVLFACQHWHYSKSLPAGRLFKVGVWENEAFIGCVLFGLGANKNINKPYGLNKNEVCELVRVALKQHKSFVSQILSLAIKELKKHNPDLQLIVSYADANQNHIGIIYQATNWIFEGEVVSREIKLGNKVYHKRSISNKFGSYVKAEYVKGLPKYKYLMPLNKKIKKQLSKRHKPYPKN